MGEVCESWNKRGKVRKQKVYSVNTLRSFKLAIVNKSEEYTPVQVLDCPRVIE